MSILKQALIGNPSTSLSVGNSAAFKSEAFDGLTRTMVLSSADKRTFTISAFIKRSNIDIFPVLIGTGSSHSVSPYETKLVFNGDGTMSFVWNGNGASGDVWITTEVLRDVSEWYHIVVQGDIGNAIRADRVKIFINNKEFTMTPTGAAGNSGTTRWLSAAEPMVIGKSAWIANNNPYDGYISEFYLIDGQALDPDEFGVLDSATNQWVAKEYTGTYGTNGFYLDFSNVNEGNIVPIGTITAPFGGIASNALNGDSIYLTSNLSSGSSFTGVQVDFGEIKHIRAFDTTGIRFTNNVTSSATVDISNDGFFWTTVANYTLLPTYQNVIDYVINKSCRYIRVRMTAFGTNGIFEIDRISAYEMGIGSDVSGNGNHFTNSGVTQSVDSPTNNYPLLNDLDNLNTTYAAVQKTGTRANLGTGLITAFTSTMSSKTLKYYFEVLGVYIDGTVNNGFGIGVTTGHTTATDIKNNAIFYQSRLGEKRIYNVGTAYGSSYATGDIIGVAVDCASGTIEFFKNGVSQGVIAEPTLSDGDFTPLIINNSSTANSLSDIFFTEDSWTYSAPSGFSSLSTANLPNPDIAKPINYFNTYLYEGNGAGLQVGDHVKDIDLYPLSNSGAFALEDTDYLNRTPNVDGNKQTWTFSTWVKCSNFGSRKDLFASGYYIANSNQYDEQIVYNADNTISYFFKINSVTQGYVYSNIKVADSGKYQHVLVNRNGTSVDIYINGILDISVITPVTLADSQFNNSPQPHFLGKHIPGISGGYYNGYMSETIFIDGQALTPSDFGQTDGNSFWVPKQYVGTYGTNGFHLDFTNNSDLGEDSSGNNNDFTNNGVTQSVDTPTKNIAICDASDGSTTVAISESGKRVKGVGANFGISPSSLAMTSGKYYMEVLVNALGNNASIVGTGTHEPIIDGSNQNGLELGTVSLNLDSLSGFRGIFVDGTFVASMTATNVNDIIGIALDVDNSEVTFYRNNIIIGSGSYPISHATSNYYFYVYGRINVGTSDMTTRYSSTNWTYSAPTDFIELNSNNLEDVDGLGKPDLVWIKNRDATQDHYLYDTTRGIGNSISSNTFDHEQTDVNSLLQFNKAGFYLGSSSKVNTVNNSYVAWCWEKGVTPGFDIIQYSGTGSVQNINHNLGTIPDMIIYKKINTATATNWAVYHKDTFTGSASYYLNLNTPNARTLLVNMWNGTPPSSTQFTVGTDSTGNTIGTNNHIAYAFTSVEGFSKFDSYTGNGSTDGPFINLGFKPAFVMIKNLSVLNDWVILDNIKESNNPQALSNEPNTNVIDQVYGGGGYDLLSNGFKLREPGTTINTLSNNYIYAAFAENPFKTTRAR